MEENCASLESYHPQEALYCPAAPREKSKMGNSISAPWVPGFHFCLPSRTWLPRKALLLPNLAPDLLNVRRF